MDDKLLEKTILFSSLNLQFLDFIDEMYEKEDFSAKICVNSFFDRKDFSYEQFKGFSSLPTSLGLLTSIIFYIRISAHKDSSIQIENSFKIRCFENDQEANFSTEKILKTMRNSIAHNSENNEQNVFTENDKIIFQQKHGNSFCRVEFDIDSFHLFIKWLIKTARETVRKTIG